MARMRAPARRRQLLEVAADVFSRKGYHGATTAELAREAGITEPILYRHFTSKLELFGTLIDEVGNNAVATWQESLEAATTPADRLRILMTANPAVRGRGQGVYRVIIQAMTSNADEAEIRTTLRRHLRKLQMFVAFELAVAQDNGLIGADIEIDVLSWMLVDMTVGFGLIGPLDVPGHNKAAGAGRVHKLLASLLSN